MEEKERRKRENQITFMVQLYFEKLNYLDKNTLGEWTNKALNAFLDTDLSIDEINDIMSETFKKKSEDFIMEREERNDSELKFMFVENENEGVSQELDSSRQYVKSSSDLSSDSGFINNIVITTLALITFTLSGIGLALIYLLQR